MGRFFNIVPLQFMQGTMYQDPHELMIKVIENDNKIRALYEAEANKSEQELLASPHLGFDKEYLDSVISGYNSEIEAITNDIHNNVNVTASAGKRMKNLQKRILQDRLNGDLANITGRYNAMQNFAKENAKLKEEDPSAYNMAMSFEMDRLEKETAKDKKASFSPYRIIGKPKFREDLVKEIDKLKASEDTVLDGNGYKVKIKNLTPDRIMQLAVSSIISRPEYAEYARQQTRYGRSGFMDEDGIMLDPYSLVDKNGNPVTNYDELTPEQRLGVRRVLNSRWAFSPELSGIIAANAYQQRDIDSDSTWVAKMNEAGRNSRHAQDHQLARDKFEFDKQKHNDDMNLELEKLRRASSPRGGSRSGSGSGSGGSGDLLHDNIQGHGVLSIQTRNTDTFSLAADMANYKTNDASKARFEGTLGSAARASKVLNQYYLDGRKLSDVLLSAGFRGQDVSTPKKFADYIVPLVEKELKKKNGILTIGGRHYNSAKEAAQAYASLSTNVYRRADELYKGLNETTQSVDTYALPAHEASNLMTSLGILAKTEGNVFLYDLDDRTNSAKSHEETEKKLREIASDSRYTIRVGPSANSENGGAIYVTLGANHGEDGFGAVNETLKTYVIKTGRGTDNSAVISAINKARSQYSRDQAEYYALGNFSRAVQNGFNAGLSKIVPSRQDLYYLGGQHGVDTSWISRSEIDASQGVLNVSTTDGRSFSVPIMTHGVQNSPTSLAMNAELAIVQASSDPRVNHNLTGR